MTTTLGDLVSELFEAYERSYGDETLAALATQARITELLRASRVRTCAREPRSLGPLRPAR